MDSIDRNNPSKKLWRYLLVLKWTIILGMIGSSLGLYHFFMYGPVVDTNDRLAFYELSDDDPSSVTSELRNLNPIRLKETEIGHQMTWAIDAS